MPPYYPVLLPLLAGTHTGQESPGLSPAKAPGRSALFALRREKVSRFLWERAQERAHPRAQKCERLDRRRVYQGAGRLGRRPGPNPRVLSARPGDPSRACARARVSCHRASSSEAGRGPGPSAFRRALRREKGSREPFSRLSALREKDSREPFSQPAGLETRYRKHLCTRVRGQRAADRRRPAALLRS